MNTMLRLRLILLLFLSINIFSNSSNSFGTVGINLTPTARFYEEGIIGWKYQFFMLIYLKENSQLL